MTRSDLPPGLEHRLRSEFAGDAYLLNLDGDAVMSTVDSRLTRERRVRDGALAVGAALFVAALSVVLALGLGRPTSVGGPHPTVSPSPTANVFDPGLSLRSVPADLGLIVDPADGATREPRINNMPK